MMKNGEKEAGQITYIGRGTAALDKVDNSKFLMVELNETFPFKEGEVGHIYEKQSHNGTDDNDESYSTDVNVGTTVKAEWYPESNRRTSPSVVKGERVDIYTVGNSDVYKWRSAGLDEHLRRTERVTINIMASGEGSDTDVTPDINNQYIFEMNSKEGHISLTTSDDNGELTPCTIQLNTKKGIFSLKSGNENIIQFDFSDGHFLAMNYNKTIVEMKDKDLKLKAKGDILIESGGKVKIKSKSETMVDAGADIILKASGICNVKASVLKFANKLTGKMINFSVKLEGPMAKFNLVVSKIVSSTSCT